MDNRSTLTSWSDSRWPDYAPDEILPRLFQGGTEDECVIGCPTPTDHYDLLERHGRAAYPYDLVVTLYADAQPAPWGVREMRFGFPDGPLGNSDARHAVDLARMAHRAWRSGDQVLIRCQAGVNRSGLVTALVLMLDGYDPTKAIDLLRRRRSPVVLSNRDFVAWLMTEAPRLIGEFNNPSDQAA